MTMIISGKREVLIDDLITYWMLGRLQRIQILAITRYLAHWHLLIACNLLALNRVKDDLDRLFLNHKGLLMILHLGD